MYKDIIERKSYIITQKRMRDVYQGRDKYLSHIVLVPASKIVPFEVIKGDIHKIICFKHYPELVDCKYQLEKSFGDKIPFAVISEESLLLYRKNNDLYTISDEFLFDDWSFNKELGNGKQFLQIAQVSAKKSKGNSCHEEFVKFFSSDPLNTLKDRSYVNNTRG